MTRPIVRERRYAATADADLVLFIETSEGNKLRLKVINVSESGISASAQGVAKSDTELEPGSVIPCAKLLWKADAQEIVLGRMNVRRCTIADDGALSLVCTVIDDIIPVTGPLAFQLEESNESGGQRQSHEVNPEKFSLGDVAQSGDENIDLLSRFEAIKVYRNEWRKKPMYMYETVRTPSKGTRVKLKTPRKLGRDNFVIMGSNDYLGLASHPEVIEAAKQALDQYGFGSTGSPMTTGRTAIHEELREYVAQIFKKESVILFNSGYAANVGALSAMIHAGDFVVADSICHASIQDALQMCKGAVRYFKHNDMAHLDRLLTEQREHHRGCLIVTEGVFSMDGDLAKMAEIIEIAKHHRARTYLDEAHSFGVIGDRGLGLWETLDTDQNVDVIMGTFSKICGGIGGFIAGDQQVHDWLHFFARSQVFSVSLPPSNAAGVLKALQIFMTQKQLLTQLRENIAYFAKGMRRLGAPLAEDHQSAVIPVVIGDERKLSIMTECLLEGGIYVIPIVFPAVRRGGSRFRFTVMATHTQSDLDLVLSQFEKAMSMADFRFADNGMEQIKTALSASQRLRKIA